MTVPADRAYYGRRPRLSAVRASPTAPGQKKAAPEGGSICCDRERTYMLSRNAIFSMPMFFAEDSTTVSVS